LDAATVNRRILAIGGFDPQGPRGNNSVDFVEARLNGGDGTWHDIAPLPVPRSNAQVAVLDGLVYVTGGVGPHHAELEGVVIFNPSPGSWQAGPDLPERRSAGAAATLNHWLYVAGGYVSTQQSKPRETESVISYNPKDQSWTSVAPMRQSRGFLRMVAAGGYLYAIGGNHAGNTVPTVERYNPTSDSWTTVDPMHQDRGVPGAVVTQNLIVVVGGTHIGDQSAILRSTEIYDLNIGKWRTLSAQLAQPRTSLACALDESGAILAIGGEVDGDGTTSASTAVEALDLQEAARPVNDRHHQIPK